MIKLIKTFKNHKEIPLILAFLLALLCFFSRFNLCYIKMGSVDFVFAVSDPHITRSDIDHLKHEDYISFIFNKDNDPYVKKGLKLTKRIACLPGEYLQETKTEVYCNNKLIGLVQPKDSKSRPVKPFLFDGSIPNGKLFVVGDNLMSYDSKYFGFIDKDWITEKILFSIW